MALFNRKNFHQLLTQAEEGSRAPVYLLYGEGYLVKSALSQLVERLIPRARQATNLELEDGAQVDFRQVVQSLNTFPLFPGRKAVVVQDCRLFYSQADLPALFARSKAAQEAGERETAARLLLEFLAYAGWSLDELAGSGWREIPAHLWQQTTGMEQDPARFAWLEAVLEHASSSGLQVPQRHDDAALLEAAIRHGFPPKHCLLLTTDTVDRRRSLYRLIEERGMVVDMTVASGTGRQARSHQEAVLTSVARETLAAAGKKIEPAALALLLQRTGFNLWALKTQLEKLTAFVGAEALITREQAEELTQQFRQEALYELNNAVARRDCAASLLALNRLLEQGYHPLQLLASLANEFRRLLAGCHFIDNQLPGRLDPAISYGKFQQKIYPSIRGATGKGSPLAALHPYALYQTLRRSSGFSRAGLAQLLHEVFIAELGLKTTSLAPRAVLEKLVFSICRPSS